MKYRVFKESIGWSEGLFIFPFEIKFSEISNFPQTHFICKDNYLGEFTFDLKFLKILNQGKINDKTFWFEYLFEHDSDDSIKNKKEPLMREEPKIVPKIVPKKQLPENESLF